MVSPTFEVTAYRTLWFDLQYDSETVEQGETVGNGHLQRQFAAFKDVVGDNVHKGVFTAYRSPDSYAYKWRAAILVDGYLVWSRGFKSKQVTAFQDALRDRPVPELNCPECPNDDILVGEKSADGAKVQR